MDDQLGSGPEDWGYAQYIADDRSDGRWALPSLALLRGLVTWITGKDPVQERRRRRLAEEQAANASKFADREHEAFRHLATDPPRTRVEAPEAWPTKPGAGPAASR